MWGQTNPEGTPPDKLRVWALVSEPGFLKFQIFRFSILAFFGGEMRKLCMHVFRLPTLLNELLQVF